MRALITGVTGQDGSYLAELLLEKSYEVYGMVRNLRRQSSQRLAGVEKRVHFVEADLTDQSSLDRVMQQVCPDEIYNLAGQTFIPVAWSQPLLTMEITGMGALRLLEAMRRHSPKTKFLQASSSEIFGRAEGAQQNENTRMQPTNPYGAAKLFAHHVTINYRESYGMFACSCISFNHESPRRGVEFVTRKVAQQVARIKQGHAEKLKMGNLGGRRDWGFAGDYVRAMWLMLQQSQPEDFVIATGVTHSVKELLEIAFAYAGLDWKKYVEVDPALVRPAEPDPLCGDASKAHRILGWTPKVSFRQLVEMMVESELAAQANSTQSNKPTVITGD
ncbi:MAG TPA: GDP-mannose 4,6-dehydratase [Candidatus Angelobacter sp.]|nr:GDP-mannose 4,6-dehydratase [Candidatus Angelobacter sp.]